MNKFDDKNKTNTSHEERPSFYWQFWFHVIFVTPLGVYISFF